MSDVRVVCLGELMWDFHTPFGESLATASEYRRVAGGAAANVAIHLNGRGIRCAVAGVVSRDALGESLCAELQAAGIDVTAVQRRAGRTGLVFIEHLSPGDESVVSYRPHFDRPACHYPLPQTASESEPLLLYLAALVPQHADLTALIDAAARTREQGGRVVLDLNARPQAWRGHGGLSDDAKRLIAHADLVKASRGDLEVLGMPDAAHLGDLLAEDASYVVTDGAGPVLLSSPVGDVSYRPPRLSIATTVGAGDAFDAGMIACLLSRAWPADVQAWREVVTAGYKVAAAHIAER
jgi:fructokinase